VTTPQIVLAINPYRIANFFIQMLDEMTPIDYGYFFNTSVGVAMRWVTQMLLLVAGINYGLVGLFGIDLFQLLFGGTLIERLLYLVIGMAALIRLSILRDRRRSRRLNIGQIGSAFGDADHFWRGSSPLCR